MKKILRSFLACTLSLLMCLGSFAFAGAEGTAVAISATEDTTIKTADFTTLYGGAANHNSTGNYAFCTGAYVETVIDVAEEGYYMMSVNATVRSAKAATYSVAVDDIVQDTFTVWGEGVAFDNEVCDVYLKKGQQKLKVAYVSPASVYNYLSSVTFSKKSVESKSIWKNATDVSDTATYTQIAHNMYYTSAGKPIGYTINVPEGGAGLYQMYIQTARVDANITSYDVTVNGDAVMTSKAAIPQNNPSAGNVWAGQEQLVPMCYVTLKEGENSVVFTNNGAFMYFARLKFDKANLDENSILLNASGSTEISLAKASLSNVGYVADNGNHYKFTAGSSATVDLNVLKAGVYTLNVNVLTRDGITNTWNVYIDGKLYDTYYTWLAPSVWYEGEALDIEFETTGLHTLKIETTKANAYMDVFTLTKKEKDNKALWILGKDAVAGTGSVTWEQYQLDNGGNVQEYGEYKVNVEDAGIYKITSQTGYNTYDLTSAVLTVNGAEANVVTISKAIRGSYADEKITTDLGNVYLNAGENTIRITNKDLPGGQTLIVTRLKIDKVSNATALSTTEPTEISLDTAVLSKIEVNHNGTGNYKYGNGSYTLSTVYVTTPGVYTMNVKVLTRDQLKNTWNVYVDDVLEGTFYTWLGNIWYEGEAIDIDFKTAGAHTIKIETPTANAYMNGFTLTKKATDFKAQWVLGTTASGTGAVAHEKYHITNNGNVQQYAEYNVNVDSTGVYRITMQSTFNEVELTSAVLAVNGTEIGAVNVDAAIRGAYGDEQVITVLGDAVLDAGSNKIKIINRDLPNGQSLRITRIKVEKISDEVPNNVRLHIRDYDKAYAPGNTADTSQLGQEGANPDNTLFRENDWAEYTVEIRKAGSYDFGLCFGAANAQKVAVYVDGSEKLVADYAGVSGSYAKTDVVLGKLNFAKEGTYTIKVAKVSGSFAYVSHLFLNYAGSIEKDVRLHMRSYNQAYAPANSANTSQLGQDGGNPDNTLFRAGDWAEYSVEILAPGAYDFGICYGANSAQKVEVYVNGTKKLDANYAGGSDYTKVDTVLGKLNFFETGTYTIKVAKVDGNFAYASHIFFNYAGEVSADIKMHVRDYNQAYAPANSANTSQLGQDGGNPDNTLFRENDWAEYTIDILRPGVYDFGLAFGAANPQTVKAYIDGTEVLTGGYAGVAGNYTKANVVLGKINFINEGTYTLKIHKTTGGFAYVSHVFLNYAGELPVYEINTTETTQIAAKDYASGFDVSKNTSQMTVEGENISFGSKDYIEYFINAEKTALYKIAVTTACETSGTPIFDVLVDGKVNTRMLAANKGWSTQGVTEGYIILEEGQHTLRIFNCGHPDFYLCNLAISYSGDVVEVSDANIAAATVSGTKNAGSVTAIAVNAEQSGIYKFNLKARLMSATVMNVYNNEALSSVKTMAQSSGDVDNFEYIRLEKGYNVIKLEIASGRALFRGFEIGAIVESDEAVAKAALADVQNAKTVEELLAAINDNVDAFGIDYAEATEAIQYDEYVLIRLLNGNYVSDVDFVRAFYNAVAIEETTPSVTTSITDGTMTIVAKSNVYAADGTFVVAVYDNSNNKSRMIGTNFVTFTRGETVTLTVPNCKEEYAVKFFCFNDITKMAPISLANGVYEYIYVSPNGSADGDGSEANPYATLDQAKARVAELRDSMTGDIVVNFAPGYYELTETAVFDATNGGKGNFNVIYRGTDADNASIIGGGKKVTGWTSVGNGIYSADFDGEYVRDLYVNGYPAVRARSNSLTATARDGKTLTAEIGNLNFANPENLITVWFNEWTNHYIAVEGLTKNGTTATITLSDKVNFQTGTGVIDIFKDDTSSEAKCDWHGVYHKTFYLENALELLDEAGEFYYDEAAGKIYYKPYSEEDINSSDIYASQVEFLMNVSGADNNNKISNVIFDNLSFRYSTWNNNEIIDIQATQYVSDFTDNVRTYSEIPSQIKVNYANDIAFTNCEFTCLGSNALGFYDAVTNSKISGNIFRDLSGAAIVIGSYTHEHEIFNGETCTNIEISDNVIRRTSLVWRGMPSVTAYYEKDVDIVRNDIKDVPYTGISLGWGWGNTTASFGDYTVSNNRVLNVMQTLYDGAHIYTLGDMPGTVISNNYFYGSPDGRGGIYNDSGSGNIDILNNVVDVYKNGTSYWWFQGVYKTHDLYADGNFAHSKLDAQQRASGINNVYGDNTNLASAGTWDGAGNAQAQAIIDVAGVSENYTSLIEKANLPAWRSNPLERP